MVGGGVTGDVATEDLLHYCVSKRPSENGEG